MAGSFLVDGNALITGASIFFYPFQTSLTRLPQAASGIGKETAIAFAEAGAKGIILADINEDGARTAAEETQKGAKDPSLKVLALKVDITDEASVDNMVQNAVAAFGRIDYSINSAGVCMLSAADISPRLNNTDARLDFYLDWQYFWCSDTEYKS